MIYLKVMIVYYMLQISINSFHINIYLLYTNNLKHINKMLFFLIRNTLFQLNENMHELKKLVFI